MTHPLFDSGELICARRVPCDWTKNRCSSCLFTGVSLCPPRMYICTVSPGINPYTRKMMYVDHMIVCSDCMFRRYKEKIKLTLQLSCRIAGEGNSIHWIFKELAKHLPFIA